MNRKYILGRILLVIILVAGLLLWPRSTKKENVTNEEAKYYHESMLGFATEKGFYHTDSREFLCFYDFSAQKDVYVCNRPNCKHDSTNSGNNSDTTRCNADLGWTMNTGFTINDRLYLIQVDPIEHLAVITQSDLDRSNQKKIVEFESDYIESFVEKDGVLYLAASSYIMEKDEDGMEAPSGEAETWLYGVDLSIGESKELTPRIKANNASLAIVGVDGNSLYCKNTYFKNPYDGSNFEEAQEQLKWYSFNMDTEKYEEIFSGFSGAGNANISNGKLCGYEGIEWQDGEFGQYNVLLLDLKTSKSNLVASSQEEPQFAKGKVFFKNEEEGKTQYYIYDVVDGEQRTIPGSRVNDFIVSQEAGEYFYGFKIDSQTQESTMCLISKTDFFEGEAKYISLKW